MCSDRLNAATAAPTLAWIIHAVVGKSKREKEGGGLLASASPRAGRMRPAEAIGELV